MYIMGLHIVQWLLVLLLSLVLPLSILYGRGNVRRRRLALLDDLEKIFHAARPELQAGVQPMMQFVRSRYTNSQGGDQDRLLSLDEIKTYLLPATILVLLSGVGFYELFAALRLDGFKPPIMLLLGPMSAENNESYQAGTALVVAAAFLGAYIWSIRYLILRIANFDLSPLSFLRVSAHILLAIMLAWIFRHVVAAMPLVGGPKMQSRSACCWASCS